MANESETRNCPYCKESILVDAIKCKHCGSSVSAKKPAHKGICPYCKENIHLEAVKCKHCKSMLNKRIEDDCGCGDGMQKLERTSTSSIYSPAQYIDYQSEINGSLQQSQNLFPIFCRQRCLEWSELFPNICNRSVWECTWGPIIIIWGSSQVAKR